MYYNFSFVLFIFKKLVVFHNTDKIGNVANKPLFFMIDIDRRQIFGMFTMFINFISKSQYQKCQISLNLRE